MYDRSVENGVDERADENPHFADHPRTPQPRLFNRRSRRDCRQGQRYNTLPQQLLSRLCIEMVQPTQTTFSSSSSFPRLNVPWQLAMDSAGIKWPVIYTKIPGKDVLLPSNRHYIYRWEEGDGEREAGI